MEVEVGTPNSPTASRLRRYVTVINITTAMIISQLHLFRTQNQQFYEIGESTVVGWGPSSGYHDCWYLDDAPR